MRVVQIEPGALADLDGVGAAIGEVFHAGGAGHVAGDDGQLRKGVAQHFHRVAHAFAVAVRGGNRHHIHAAFHQPADVRENPLAVQFAKGVARGAHRRAADQAELRVARGLELRLAFLRDALDVAHRDEAVQMVVVVHHEQLVDAEMLGEKFVGARNRILAQLLLGDGVNLLARRQRLNDFLRGIARLDDMAGKQADQLALFIHHGKRAETEFLFLNQFQHVANKLVRRDLDRVLDQTLDVVLDAAHLRELLALRHVVMDQAEAAVERHRNGHARLGDGVHVGGDGRDVQLQAVRERGVELGVAREDFRIKRRQRDVVEREAYLAVRGEERIRRLVERVVEIGIACRCHVRKCLRHTGFGKQISMRMQMIQNVRPLQPVRQHQLLVGEQFHRATVGDDLAAIQNDRPRAQLHRQFQIVRGDELRRRQRPQQALNSRRPRGSRSLVGSSSTSTAGSHAITPARQARRFSPWLK